MKGVLRNLFIAMALAGFVSTFATNPSEPRGHQALAQLPTSTPTNTPLVSPTNTPTSTPTLPPTETPTDTPTPTATPIPTFTPTPNPTLVPTPVAGTAADVPALDSRALGFLALMLGVAGLAMTRFLFGKN